MSNPHEELLALAARLVVAADALDRRPYEIESLRQDCLAAADVIRLMEEDAPDAGILAARSSRIHSKRCLVHKNAGVCTCATVIRMNGHQ